MRVSIVDRYGAMSQASPEQETHPALGKPSGHRAECLPMRSNTRKPMMQHAKLAGPAQESLLPLNPLLCTVYRQPTKSGY